MKILLVNKFHWPKGGSEKYYFELGELLKAHGHEVAYFSMEDEKNIKTGDKEYFVKASDMNSKNITKALSVIYSKANKKKMEEALDDFKPDIVHLNNFQRQLSASIIEPCVKRNIPVVFTAHDLQTVCPAITMMDSNKKTCELCLNGNYKNCLKKKCIKNSTLKSLLGAIEGAYYRKNKVYTRKIDAIITPTEFYKKMLIKDGIDANKIHKIHNFLYLDDYQQKTSESNLILYIGRLSLEKGILNLVKSFKDINDYVLYILGDGPEKSNITNYILENKLQKKIKLMGFLEPSEVRKYISKCLCVVVPSTWYENGSYVAMETEAIGKPVIGADIGGIPEIVKDGKTGYLYIHDSVEDLTEKITQIINDKSRTKMGKEGKEYIKKEFSSESHYKKIIGLYKELIENKKGRKATREDNRK